jgi:hypothetical protein
MKFSPSKSTRKPFILNYSYYVLLLTGAVAACIFTHRGRGGACPAFEDMPAAEVLAAPPHDTGSTYRHAPDNTIGIKAAHPLAIVYLAQKVHSSYGEDTLPCLHQSLELLYANVIPNTPADVLIFHEGERVGVKGSKKTTYNQLPH